MSIWAYKDTTLYSNGGQSFNLRAEFTEYNLTDEYKLANKSPVNCKATLNCYGTAWSTSYPSKLSIYWHDNRENYDRLVNSSSFKGGSGVISVEGTIDVYHKEDGSLWGYAYAVFEKGSTTSSFAPNNGGIATEWTQLTKINRYPVITNATNFNDEGNPTITFTTNSGFSNATYSACISLDGTTDNVPYRNITLGSGTYTFELTNEERATLRNATPNSNTLTLTFILRTTANGTNYYSSATSNMTIINGSPTFTYTIEEKNQDVINVLGTNVADKIVQDISEIEFDITPTTLKGASISQIIINNGESSNIKTYTITSSPYEITITANSGKFQIIVIDSRGNTTTQNITKQLIEYLKLKINSFSFERENTTSSNIILNLDSVYKDMSNDNITNTPVVKWKLDNGNYTTIPSMEYSIDTTNNKLTITNYELTNTLVYTSSGNFTIDISDLFSSANDNIVVNKGIPTMDLGEHDLQVNGDIIIADTDGDNGASVKNLFGKKVWVNPDPSSAFPTQQITLSSDDYDVLEWHFIDSSRIYIFTTKTIKGYGTQFEYFSISVWDRHWARRITYSSDKKYIIGDCMKFETNSSVFENNNLVPLYVIAYKNDIFN